MSKCVQTPSGPLAPADNPKPNVPPSPTSPTKFIGLYHQYLLVDMVDKDSHHIPKGGTAGPSGQFIGSELISPNKMRAIKAAGLHAVIHEAVALQQQCNQALEALSDVPMNIGSNILEPSMPFDGNSVTEHVATAIF